MAKNDIFFKNGKKVFSSTTKDLFFDDGKKAYSGCTGDVFYSNGKKAYSTTLGKGFYENGNALGTSGVNYSSDGVSMNLTEAINTFRVGLGEGFEALIEIGKKPSYKNVKLLAGGSIVFQTN